MDLYTSDNDPIDTDAANDNPVLTSAVGRVFFQYLGPSVLGLLAVSTASVVDGLLVGHYLGGEALAAVNLLIPLITVWFGLVLMLAIGGSVQAGRVLGQGARSQVGEIINSSLVGTLVVAVTLVLFCYTMHAQLFQLLGAPEAIRHLLKRYLFVLLIGVTPQLLAVLFYYFVRAFGQPGIATRALVLGALVNILLDIVFLGYMGWGIESAAWATVIAQLTQCIFLLNPFCQIVQDFNLRLRWVKLLTLWRSMCNGFSEFANEISGGAVIYLVHFLLIANLGVQGVAGYAIVNYGIFINLMAICAIAEVVHVLVSQNAGAQRWVRVKAVVWFAVSSILVVSLATIAALTLGAQTVAGWVFQSADVSATEHTLVFSELLWPLFLFNGMNILASAYLTAVHRPGPSATIAICRGLLFPVGFLLLFDRLLPEAFLIGLPVAEAMTFFISIVLIWRSRPSLQSPSSARAVTA